MRDETSSGLSAAALREAERGFRAKLVAKRLSPAFIERYFDEVMSQARQEYAAWLKDGHEADNPVGWLINCAWWRLLDLLDRERRRPQSVSLETLYAAVDKSSPNPEAIAIGDERAALLEQALKRLAPRERMLLELSCLQGMSVRAAGRQVGWGKSAADRHFRAAALRLRPLLERDLGAGARLSRSRH